MNIIRETTMGLHTKKKTKTNSAFVNDFYNYSLGKIFWKSSVMMLICMAVATVLISIVLLFSGRTDYEDMIKLLAFWVLLALVLSFTAPILSLLRTFEQEAIIGIKYKDRTDFQKDKNERDWYIDFVRGGFILYHRNFVKKILRTLKEEEIAYGNENIERTKIYVLFFEDVHGKKRKITFSSTSEEQAFRKWYKMGKRIKNVVPNDNHSC